MIEVVLVIIFVISLVVLKAEKRAVENGCAEILICTAYFAIMQLNFYQKMGYELFRVIKDFFITNYPEPVFENGKQLKDMLMLRKKL